MQLCKLETMPSTHSQPMYISHCIIIKLDFAWELFVNGDHVEHESSTLFSEIPTYLSSDAFTMLVTICDSAYICHGYPKKEYLAYAESHKGVFKNKNGEVRAQIDSTHPVMMNREIYQSTIRTTECAIVADNTPLCDKCKDFGPVLHSTYSRWQGTSCNEVSKFTNNRYLTSPQKHANLKQLQERVMHKKREKIGLTERIEKLTSGDGIEVESSFHQDLFSIMQESNTKIASQFHNATFRRFFSVSGSCERAQANPTMIMLIFIC